MRAWVNGRLLADATAPAVSVIDHGFTVGDGIFETLNVVEGKPFALTRHLVRLAHSAAGMGLTPPDPDVVRRAIDEVLAGFDTPLGRLRITVTPGPAPMGSERGHDTATLAVVAAPASPWQPTTAAIIVDWPRNERGPLVGLKTTSYAENVIALGRAAAHHASEALFANLQGNLCEGTGTNIFYVVDGELRTPTLESGCLAGVTRALVLEWCGGREVDAPIDVLSEASEVFLTSSTRDIHPVHRIGDREYDVPGPVTRAAMAQWALRQAQDLDP